MNGVCVHRCRRPVCATATPGSFGASAERRWAGEGLTLWNRPHPAGCWPGSCLQHRPAGDGGRKNTNLGGKINNAIRRSEPWRLCLCTCKQYDHQRVSMLADRLVQKIMSAIPDVVMNGDPSQRYPGTRHKHTGTSSA